MPSSKFTAIENNSYHAYVCPNSSNVVVVDGVTVIDETYVLVLVTVIVIEFEVSVPHDTEKVDEAGADVGVSSSVVVPPVVPPNVFKSGSKFKVVAEKDNSGNVVMLEALDAVNDN